MQKSLAFNGRRTAGTNGRGHVLITGGAGFVGTNLADRLLEQGRRVIVLDTLVRPGVERNLRWLQARHGDRLQALRADVRDVGPLREAVAAAESVFHLAAQVAVTTSLDEPLDDLDVNLCGTVALLEELRRLRRPVPLLFTSTNKVYGPLDDVELERKGDRWLPRDEVLRRRGVGEERPLEFRTPYGCSKGAADQYVVDYAKTFGLPATVFRMSCIYGSHQHGTEDQGWVAHFLRRARAGETITVYGDGAQVRDVLHVRDLVDAMLHVAAEPGRHAGCVYNVGGGPAAEISLLELLRLIGDLEGHDPIVEFAEPRTGDQLWYVSDNSRLCAATEWRPTLGTAEGIADLHRWLVAESSPRAAAASAG
ncbi:MAG TPA: NAD-dependent epimerase/dehydratase family protein [Gaiellaceae bacterium]|nr:NAD-dependent epimerase/dehydratase family protein [Gaiellaceae bacterium]